MHVAVSYSAQERLYLGIIIMTLSIRTNTAALNSARSIDVNSASLARTTKELASGLRINTAADDPAGLAISSLISSKIAEMEQNLLNIGQGISLAQTVEGALSQQNNILVRLSSLAAQSANGVLTNDQRVATIQPEIDSLITQFNKIGNSASFNGLQLLAGGTTGVTATVAAGSVANTNLTTAAQTSPNGTAAITFQSNAISTADTATVTMTSGGLMTMTWTTAAGLVTTGTASANVATGLSANGGTSATQAISFFDASGTTMATATIQAGVTAVVATTTDVALTLATGTANLFTIQAGPGNNVNSQLTVTVEESLTEDYGLTNLSMRTQAEAQLAIATVTSAITTLATARASVGATISQLNQAEGFTSTSLIISQTALGEIIDVDVANAAASLAQQSVLVQAATAMLAQANQQPQTVLALLRG